MKRMNSGDAIRVTFKKSVHNGTVISAWTDSTGKLLINAEWYNDSGKVIGSHTFFEDEIGIVIHKI